MSVAEREIQGCADCPNSNWCLPQQVDYQLAGGRSEAFPCALENKEQPEARTPGELKTLWPIKPDQGEPKR